MEVGSSFTFKSRFDVAQEIRGLGAVTPSSHHPAAWSPVVCMGRDRVVGQGPGLGQTRPWGQEGLGWEGGVGSARAGWPGQARPGRAGSGGFRLVGVGGGWGLC